MLNSAGNKHIPPNVKLFLDHKFKFLVVFGVQIKLCDVSDSIFVSLYWLCVLLVQHCCKIVASPSLFICGAVIFVHELHILEHIYNSTHSRNRHRHPFPPRQNNPRFNSAVSY